MTIAEQITRAKADYDAVYTAGYEKGKAEEIIKHAEIPDYVKKEAIEVANKVNSVRTKDSIVFLAMSDSHYYGTQGNDSDGKQGNTCNLHGAMGAKILAYALNLDFVTHLGDATWGHSTTDSEMLNSQINTFFGMLDESHANLPRFYAIGNHDTGLYYHNEMIKAGNTGVYTETGENLYNKFTALSVSEDTVFGGEAYGGYCYRDFVDKKLRVFLLNTSESHLYNQQDANMLSSQLVWFKEALVDLNEKEDADRWSYIVLCHYPADYGSGLLSKTLKSYINGIEDFTGINRARFIAQFHGHIHNFLASKLYDADKVQFDAWRIAVPNGQYNRENYYDDYKEDTSYPKTPNTANDTSFVVNVINPSEKKIYSFCYGAGYDRVIGYGDVTYHLINRTLVNTATDGTILSVEHGKSFSETITPNEDHDMQTVSVTMGGVDISSSAITINGSDYHISIAEVTGDIEIFARAVARVNYTNQLLISTDTDGSVYNGIGYKANSYLSSGAVGTKTGLYLSGFIPVKYGDTLYFKNCTIQAEQGYHRFAAYDSSKAFITDHQHDTTANKIVKVGTPTYGSDGNMTSLQITGNYWDEKYDVKYIRFCCSYLGEDSIVTVNEPIE